MTKQRRVTQLLAYATLASLALTGLWPTAISADASPTFGQQILPLNCVFEIVNDGTNTLRYLTPAECGVLIPDATGNTGVSAVVGPNTPSSNPNGKVAFKVSNNFVPSVSPIATGNPPWRPLVAPLNDSKTQGLAPAAGTAPVAVLIVFVFLAIAAIIVL